VYTLSIHGAKNFPFHKERSDLDIALPDGAADDAFLTALDAALPRAISACRPDVVFYLSGADPYVGDRLGKLALTKAGLAARDALVFEYCRRAGCPVAVAMGGGYAPDLHDIVEIHFQTVLAAARYCENGVRRAAS
jgi:acetoin utilization deacetylase AcuC-like enzyme